MVLMANMQMERRSDGDWCNDHQLDRGLLTESLKCNSNNSSPAGLQPCSFSSGGVRSRGGGASGGGGGLDFIEHTVSKFDTLVGVAIKYGVEVVDIKRMNGLTTDQQMFALKSLQIPLQGRHPPSKIISNGSTNLEVTPVSDTHSDLFNSIKSLKLSSSSYYGVGESFEMTVIGKSERVKVSVTNEKTDGFNKYFEKLVRRRNRKNTIH
ncbi:hypothetical protein L1887_34859 [Cichorium endivia]|nr:hypothetical protein L1887_34859 [Cichorium endivia]